MDNKTIAIVINTSWNIYNFRVGLLKALQREGYKIIIIAPADEYSQKIEDLGFKFYPVIINNKGTNPAEDIKLIYSFYQLYKKIKPDVLLHYTIKPNIYGTIAARFLSIPVINNISGLGTVFLNHGLSSKVARLLYKLALQGSKRVFFQNTHDQTLFIESTLVPEGKTALLPGSGINTSKFSPIKPIKKNNEFSFLFIARLVKDKGLIEYVEAARLLKSYPNIHFKVLGALYPGNPTAITSDKIEQWQQNNIIEYLGASDNVASPISQADCIVLPSYREGLSRVLLEASSMEKAIITTDVPGCRCVVEDGYNGFLCKVKDVDDLAKNMKKMIALGEKERAKMGKRGRQKMIDRFEENIVINHYKVAIEDILKP